MSAKSFALIVTACGILFTPQVAISAEPYVLNAVAVHADLQKKVHEGKILG